jgi:3-oxoacid CoA-transferase subunit A
MNKVVDSIDAALDGITDGATLMSGGFGLCGNPENLIEGLHRKGVKNLTIISNNCGTTDKGLGILLAAKQVRKMVSSYVGENKEFERQFLSGELEVELNPQGTLAERIRAGAFGIGGFYTRTGVGTKVAEGKETRTIDGQEFVLERPLKADFAIVRAWKADKWGNLVFNKTTKNFSTMMAMAAKVTIVEAEHIVEVGELDPEFIHVPSIFVKRIVQGTNYQKWIEQRTVRPRPAAQ